MNQQIQQIQQEQSHHGTFYKIPKFDIGFFSLELAEKFQQLLETAIAQYGNHINFWGCGWHVDALCWERYGYHDVQLKPPEWYPAYLERAKNLTPHLNKPDLELVIHDVTLEILNYLIVDKANPWVLPYSSNVVDTNKSKGKKYIESCFAKSDRLYTLTMGAWRYYKQTGETVMPSWMPDSGLMQRQPNGKSIKVYKRCPVDFE